MPTQKILDAKGYLRGLLFQLAHKHFSDRHPDWKPAGTLIEMLMQLDNMTTAMVRAPHSPQGISAGDKDRECSVDGPGTCCHTQAE